MVSLRSRTTIDTRQMIASTATATAKLTPAVRRDDAFLRDAVVRVTRQVFRNRVARRPFVVPLIVRI